MFVLTTYREGFGNVLIEAAALGIPVISTKVTGVFDAVKDGYNGILVAPNNVEELENAMGILYEDKSLRKKYGTNGLEWVKNFDQSAIWNGLLDLYNQLSK